MKIDVVSSESHYQSHLLPIFEALPDHLRGNVLPMAPPGEATRPPMGRIAMVAGWQDVNPLRGQCPMIYVEHGAGQVYVDALHDPSYSGSGGRRHSGVIGFIAPSETVAERWTSAPSVAVGCPKMDKWLNAPMPEKPSICFAWHWNGSTAPEARSAYLHYGPQLHEIINLYKSMGFRVFGHEHPKWRGAMNRMWEDYDVEILYTDEEVFAQASILMVDNSSLAYEFALIGRPVVSLNAPWYRRDVEHGLRFWEYVPGIQVEGPERLLSLNPWDLLHDTRLAGVCKEGGRLAADYAYAKPPAGMTSSQCAAQWITDLVGEV